MSLIICSMVTRCVHHCIASKLHLPFLFDWFPAFCNIVCAAYIYYYFHSNLDDGSSVRVECQIEGSTTMGTSELIEQQIIDIVLGNTFYIRGTDVLSGKSHFAYHGYCMCIHCICIDNTDIYVLCIIVNSHTHTVYLYIVLTYGCLFF